MVVILSLLDDFDFEEVLLEVLLVDVADDSVVVVRLAMLLTSNNRYAMSL